MTWMPDEKRFSDMVAHRRHLHENPEIGLELPDTHHYVQGVLEGLGLVVDGQAGHGLAVKIPGKNPGAKPIVFRADMDALPIIEATGEPFASQRHGAMHACGHDLHTATLLGIAADLVESPPERDVILAFQPGEEAHRGALKTLALDLLALPDADTFAIHVNAVVPVGTYAYCRETFMANGDWFSVRFTGEGGHASAPERVGNPVRAGSEFTEALVREAKRLSKPNARVVATVTEFLAGNTVNVIPTEGSLRGTLRTVTASQRDQVMAFVEGEAQEVAKRHRLDVDVTITEGYPAVVNTGDFVDKLRSDAGASGLEGQFSEMDHPSMVIEDFSYFLHRWPGAMVFVGAAVGDAPTFNHSATARFSQEAMRLSFQLFRFLAPPA